MSPRAVIPPAELAAISARARRLARLVFLGRITLAEADARIARRGRR